MRYLYIVGACGSIGTQTLDVIRNDNDIKVIGLSLGSNLSLASKIVNEFKPEIICLREKTHKLDISYNPIIVYGDEGLLEIARYHKGENEVFVNSLVGMAGLMPTVEAIKAKKTICLANKETLVIAGDIIKKLVKEYNVPLIPIDSEHSAILECLTGEDKSEVDNLIITASGGSFRDKERSELVNVTKKEALAHPNWSMGSKITIDSATMMNKGFEVIEAHYLFDMPYEKIKTILHPQSIVHSMVEYKDGSIKALIGTADMRNPIAYALYYPHHKYEGKKLNLIGLNLEFKELQTKRYPCLGYAYLAAEKGGIYLAVLNAANEAAVYLFLNDYIKFLEIEKIIYEAITDNKYESITYDIDNLLKVSQDLYIEILRRYGVNL